MKIERVYQMVFGENWVGEDPKALEERLQELLDTEKNYNDLVSNFKSFDRFIPRIV